MLKSGKITSFLSVSTDLAQIAAEVGILESGASDSESFYQQKNINEGNHRGIQFKTLDSEMQGLQVDGGIATPPNEPDTFPSENVNYETYFISQVDGADEEDLDNSGAQIDNQTSGQQKIEENRK